MQTQRALASSQNARLQALRQKHAAIQDKIHEEMKHPSIGAEILLRLKREKLRLKDEIEQEASRRA